MAKATIYHNPQCGTSRNTLALLRDNGADPEVIEYLKTPPSRDKVMELARKTGAGVRGLLRRNGTPYDALGLDDASLTDDQLLDAIEQHPILLQRPIVETALGTRVCRPAESVLELLPKKA